MGPKGLDGAPGPIGKTGPEGVAGPQGIPGIVEKFVAPIGNTAICVECNKHVARFHATETGAVCANCKP